MLAIQEPFLLTDKNNVKNAPTSWEDLKNGDYTVSIGDALTANQAQFAILAAAMAFEGMSRTSSRALISLPN